MKHHFESDFPVKGIDVENGVIHGATLCTAGVTAKGHNLQTDAVLLRQLLLSAKTKGVLPVGLDHKSGVRGAAGAAKNFRISGNKLLADIAFFKSHPDFNLVMDQLSELGATMGLSCSFVGEAEDGKARCSDILSADLTLHPAACPTGLFSALDEHSDSQHDEDTIMDQPIDGMNEDELGEILHHLMDRIDELETENANLREALEHDGNDETDDEQNEDCPIEEKGVRAGPHQFGALTLQTFDFESVIEENRRAGMDASKAHVEALKAFARQKYRMLNL